MKHPNLIAFILILAISGSPISALLACGFYPFGEDLRFHLLRAAAFEENEFQTFDYGFNLFSSFEEEDFENPDLNKNLALWYQYCEGKVDMPSIYEAVYLLDRTALFDTHSRNKMVVFLQKKKKKAAIEYLDFAKRAEKVNKPMDDPWERRDIRTLPYRSDLIDKVLEKATVEKEFILKKRYAFLAIRLAYYDGNKYRLNQIYAKYFQKEKPTTIIDYWAMYFKGQVEDNAALQSYYAAQVFQNAPDKQFMAYHSFDRKTPLSAILSYAQTPEEKAAVFLVKGVKKYDRALLELKNMYEYAPKGKGLGFLLLREMNKLEDWIYTPTYSNYSPVVPEGVFPYEDKTPLKRVAKDRLYAKQVLDFVETVDINKVENSVLWQTAKAELYAMTENYAASLATISAINPFPKQGTKLRQMVREIKALALITTQATDKTVLPVAIRPTILQAYQNENRQFLFALARELEMKHNTTDAALLFSRVNDQDPTKGGYNVEDGKHKFWRTKKMHKTLWHDYYTHYFSYIDAQYTVKEVEDLIAATKQNKAKDKFNGWLYGVVARDMWRLQDLVGTQYVRKNDLPKALAAFKQVNDTVWSSPFLPYKANLNANPFYKTLFSEHRRTKADSIPYNKPMIVERLMECLKLAKNPQTPNRDYYYFLVANCYFNMTHYGNSWMMRRYHWNWWLNNSGLEDDEEYLKAITAKNYYLEARKHAKTREFQILCMAMAARCENYRLEKIVQDKGYDYPDSLRTKIIETNRYKAILVQDYCDDYEILRGNCESFDTYFAMR